YELSYDPQTLKYRFVVISSHVHLSSSSLYRSNSNGVSSSDIPSLPLDNSSIDETISDSLEIRDLDWNPVGLVIRIPSGEG
ncbi:4302_t:CDS:1, partial [Paraglomus occultum]